MINSSICKCKYKKAINIVVEGLETKDVQGHVRSSSVTKTRCQSGSRSRCGFVARTCLCATSYLLPLYTNSLISFSVKL